MFIFNDFVLNGQGHGEVGQRLGGVRFEPGLMRPYIDERGRACVTIAAGMVYNNQTRQYEPQFKKCYIENLARQGVRVPTVNDTTLQQQAWIEIDRTVERALRQRLRAWTDLASRNRRGGFNAMARMTLEYQTMTDAGEAVVDMDAQTDGRRDRPLFSLRSIPLPITHSDFSFSEREIAVSRQTSTPLDTTMAENAAFKVAETIEKTLIGVETGVTYGTRSTGPAPHTGTSTVYGYTNFPYRVTKTDLTTPAGTNPEAVMTDVLEMVETMQTNGYFGPYMLYHSTGYSRYLSDDYFRSGSTSAVRSLRERIMAIEGIEDIRRLDYLTSGYQLIMIQMTPDVAQAIDGMGVTTVQWDSLGGLRHNYKVMAIQVPLLRAPYNGVGGIIHGTTS